MAEIHDYLNNFLKLEEKSQEAHQVRQSNASYKLRDEDFIIREKKTDLIQYATFYWLRLQSLRTHVKDMAEMKWGENNPKFVTNILDIRPE